MKRIALIGSGDFAEQVINLCEEIGDVSIVGYFDGNKEIGTTINVRIIQLDIGVSTQATNIMKSLAVGGMGAYAYVTMGF